MRAYNQSPAKTGVMSVTRVTTFVKRPVSFAFMPVTHLSGLSYTRCNAAPACNAEVSVTLLRADVLQSHSKSGCRWPRLPNAGRGIPRDSEHEIFGDD